MDNDNNNFQDNPQPQLDASKPIAQTFSAPFVPPAEPFVQSVEPSFQKPAEKPKKSKKVIIFIIVAIFLLIGAGVVGAIFIFPKIFESSSSVDNNGGIPINPSSGEPVASIPKIERVELEKHYKMSETAKLSRIEIRVNSVNRGYVPDGNVDIYVPDDEEVVAINITASNNESHNYMFNVLNFDLLADNLEFDIETAGIPEYDENLKSNLGAGVSLTGNLYFSLEKDATNMRLQYTESVETGDDSSPIITTTKYIFTLQ